MSRSLKKGPFIDEHLKKKIDELNETGQFKLIKTCSSKNSVIRIFII